MGASPETHDVVWTPAKVADTWDFFTRTLVGSEWYFGSHLGRFIVAAANRAVRLSGKRVLDFGCGRGDLIEDLLSRGAEASGFEFSSEAAAETARRFDGRPRFGGVRAAKELPMPFGDGSFDVVFLVEVIEHLLEDQLEATLADLHRVLAPGGAVVVTCPNDENLRAARVRCPDCGGAFHPWQHVRSFAPATISALFERAGFRTQIACGILWGRTKLVTLRTRLRNPRAPLFRPHLYYVGRRS